MKHLAIAAASSAAIAAAVIAFSYGDIPLPGGASDRSESVAQHTSTRITTTPATPAGPVAPVRDADTPAPVQLAAAGASPAALQDEPAGCGSAIGVSGQAPGTPVDAPVPAGSESEAAADGMPVDLTRLCRNETIQALDLRGLSDDGTEGTADDVQLAANRFPGMEPFKARRGAQAMGPAEETFDLLRPEASPPASSSVKTTSDYRP